MTDHQDSMGALFVKVFMALLFVSVAGILIMAKHQNIDPTELNNESDLDTHKIGNVFDKEGPFYNENDKIVSYKQYYELVREIQYSTFVSYNTEENKFELLEQHINSDVKEDIDVITMVVEDNVELYSKKLMKITNLVTDKNPIQKLISIVTTKTGSLDDLFKSSCVKSKSNESEIQFNFSKDLLNSLRQHHIINSLLTIFLERDWAYLSNPTLFNKLLHFNDFLLNGLQKLLDNNKMSKLEFYDWQKEKENKYNLIKLRQYSHIASILPRIILYHFATEDNVRMKHSAFSKSKIISEFIFKFSEHKYTIDLIIGKLYQVDRLLELGNDKHTHNAIIKKLAEINGKVNDLYLLMV